MTRIAVTKAVRSMTGYAQARSEQNGWSVRVSLRSVNHRFLDVRVHLPEGFDAFEPQMRQLVRDRIHRGHLDVTMHAELSRAPELQIDRKLAGAYLRAIEDLRREFSLAPEPQLAAVLRLPGVVTSAGLSNFSASNFSEEEMRQFGTQVQECLQQALHKLDEMRSEEGRALTREMSELLGSTGAKTARLEILSEQ